MLGLLLAVIVLGLVAWLVLQLPIPQPWRTVVLVLMVVVLIVYVLRFSGIAL